MNFDLATALTIAAGVTFLIFLFNRFFLRTRKKPWLMRFLGSLFPAIAFVFVLRSFIVEPFNIPSGSMLPTLKVGDFIVVNKFDYGVRAPISGDMILEMGEPKRGDVIVFKKPDENRFFIKRVVGLPGETITYKKSKLYINGKRPQTKFVDQDNEGTLLQEMLGDEPHTIRHDLDPHNKLDGQWLVPEGEYFVMGDNRDNSSDSRAWGTVPAKLISGKAMAVWMNKEKLLALPDFSTARVIK